LPRLFDDEYVEEKEDYHVDLTCLGETRWPFGLYIVSPEFVPGIANDTGRIMADDECTSAGLDAVIALVEERKDTTLRLKIVCEEGHKSTVLWERGSEFFRFSDEGDKRHPVAPRISYAYSHGGCCYRAACDAIRWQQQ